MSLANGEKGRAAIAKRRRTAQRAKDRAAVAAARGTTTTEAKPAKKSAK